MDTLWLHAQVSSKKEPSAENPCSIFPEAFCPPAATIATSPLVGCPVTSSRYRTSSHRLLHEQYEILPNVMLAGSCGSHVRIFLEEEEGGREGGVEVCFFLEEERVKATDVYRNQFEPQAETSANIFFKKGREHFVHFGGRNFHFCSSDFTLFSGVQHDSRLISSTSTAKPQPRNRLGTGSWAQQSSSICGNMST